MRILTAAIAFCFIPCFTNAQVTFTGVGHLPSTGSRFSSVEAVSGDGSVAVGSSSTTAFPGFSGAAFRWTPTLGTQALGYAPTGELLLEANSVNFDGTVIVGGSSFANGGAFRLTASGIESLGDLPGGTTTSNARGVSDDGNVVVGHSQSANGHEAFVWTMAGGMIGIGDLPGGDFDSTALGTSANGAVVVGYGINSTGQQEAFRWTLETGLVGLGMLAGDTRSLALEVSSDGSTIVGTTGNQAFRWTLGTGLVGLGDLAGGAFASGAHDVSADGSIIVGSATSAAGFEAFIWSSTDGMRSIKDLLIDNGVAGLEEWRFQRATGVSADGKTIVGVGINPMGQTEGWIVTIPEPGSASMMLLAGTLLLSRRRRK